MTLLEEILAHKREEVARVRAQHPLAAVQAQAAAAPPALNFVAALNDSPTRPALIAEIKRASPSRGLLADDFDPLQLARLYYQNGATAISVLTDARYFQGDLEHLRAIAQLSPRPPLLRKDFIFTSYQLYESRAAGADAVLLITAILPIDLLHELHDLAHKLGLAALVEVHTLKELESALSLNPTLIGINNRDLSDFNVDLQVTHRLRPNIPLGICVVAESGVRSPEDVAQMEAAGADAVLVGEALVGATDVASQVRALAGVDIGQG